MQAYELVLYVGSRKTTKTYLRFKVAKAVLFWGILTGNLRWRFGVAVTLRSARLVLGWVIVFGRVYHLGM